MTFKQILLFFVTVIGSMVVVFEIASCLANLQETLLGTPDTLFMIQSENFEIKFTLTSFFVILSTFFGLIEKRRSRKRLMLALAVCASVCMVFVQFYEFFIYTRVTPDGLFLRNGLTVEEKYYSWQQVDHAEINCYLEGKWLEVNYTLFFADGKKTRLHMNRLVVLRFDTEVIRARGIPVVRTAITPKQYQEILAREGRETTNDFLLKLCPYQGSPSSKVVFSSQPTAKAKLELSNFVVGITSDGMPASILIPVITTEGKEDFFYFLMDRYKLRLKDLQGNFIAEVKFQTPKQYPGPVSILIQDNKARIQMGDQQVEIGGVKNLVGYVQHVYLIKSDVKASELSI